MTDTKTLSPQVNVAPLGHISAYGLQKLQTRNHYCVSVSYEAEKEYVIPIYVGTPAPQPNAKFSIRILWGSAPEPGDEPSTYSFGTQAELDAFTEGVEAAEGWLDYQVITDDEETAHD